MDFALTDDHLALREAVRRFCEANHPADQRGHAETPTRAAQRWAGLAHLGLPGLALDAAQGGSGLGAVETMLAVHELGRVLAPAPWLANMVLAGPLLAHAADPARSAAWQQGVAQGRLKVALAWAEPGPGHDPDDVLTTAKPAATPAATPTATGWQVSGRKSLVLGADSADLLLVSVRTAGTRRDPQGLSLLAIAADTPGLRVSPIALLDGRRAATVEMQAVAVPAGHRIGALHGASPLLHLALDRANAALCAESTGALEVLLALCCEHLRTRKQFGQPLARFQVLAHRIADMTLALEQLKSMACLAAMAVDQADPTERRRLVSAAKALTAQLGRQQALVAIQLHGAMGMTDECPIGHYAKRLICNGPLLGDAAHHLQRFAGTSARPTDPPPGDTP